MRVCACVCVCEYEVCDGRTLMVSQPYCLGITPFFYMGHSGVTLPVSISTQLAHTLIILPLAGFLIAQEETWFILQVYAVYAAKCHQTSVTEELLGIVLNECHV